jgi:inorganic phosphate transporter, PiT family
MELLIIQGVTVLLGLYLAWTIGANDFANSMGDAVGSGAITIRKAVVIGALCEFAGSTLVGASVTDTLRKGIVSPEHFVNAPEMLALGMICALLAAAAWVHIASWWGMPVSTTHSIVGAVAGFGIVAAGWNSVEWGKMSGIVVSWIISPFAGGILSFTIFKLIRYFILGRERPIEAARRYVPVLTFVVFFIVAFFTLFKGLAHVLKRFDMQITDLQAIAISVTIGLCAAAVMRAHIGRRFRAQTNADLGEQLHAVERVFAPLVVTTSCSVAFAHGANDVANAIGPVAAIMDIIRSGSIQMSAFVPFWIFALGGIGIVFGLSTYGYRVLATLGTKITQLTPSRGTAADLATVTTVLVCTRLTLPVSTTHTIVGAIVGVGLARGLAAVNKEVTKDIVNSWLVTVPISAILTMILFVASRWLGLADFIRQGFAL